MDKIDQIVEKLRRALLGNNERERGDIVRNIGRALAERTYSKRDLRRVRSGLVLLSIDNVIPWEGRMFLRPLIVILDGYESAIEEALETERIARSMLQKPDWRSQLWTIASGSTISRCMYTCDFLRWAEGFNLIIVGSDEVTITELGEKVSEVAQLL